MRDSIDSPHSPYEFAYLPQVVASRAHVTARAQCLLDGLDTQAQTLSFVLGFVTLRIGCLRDIPRWLRTSAELCEPSAPQAAAQLRDAAALERLHRMLLMEDLLELHALLPRVSLASLVRGPHDPRITRHARMRELVPTRDEPLVALAVDLELAEFGRSFGPALLDACRRTLGLEVDVCRFVRARVENLDERVEARREGLEALLRERPGRAASWARVGRDVCSSYVDSLEACQGAFARARAQIVKARSL